MSDSTVYIGLDTHKKEHKAAVFAPGCDQPQEWTVRNESAEIERWVRRMQRKFPLHEIRVAYEAGVCGFDLQRRIRRPGVECKVIAPSLIPVRPGQRVHTDRRDAAGIGRYLRSGELTEVHPPNEQQEALRDLCRVREAAVEDLRRTRQRVLKFLLRRGLQYTGSKHWTQGHLAWLGGIRLEAPLAQEVLGGLLLEMEHRQERVGQWDRRLQAVAQEEEHRQPVGWLRCLQGVDTITAICLLAELYSFGRFPSPRQLMSYLGMTPSEDSSGPTVRKGPITKAGNRRVRRLLTEAAWHQRHRATASKALRARREGQPAWAIAIAQKAQERLHRRFGRLSQRGMPANKVVMAVAREMAGFVWALLQGPPPPGLPPAVRESGHCRRVRLSPGASRQAAGRKPAGGPPEGGPPVPVGRLAALGSLASVALSSAKAKPLYRDHR
jgi:transposase